MDAHQSMCACVYVYAPRAHMITRRQQSQRPSSSK